MDAKSLELLEFPLVRDALASHTSFVPGRELALKLEPLNDFECISLLLQQSAEARRLLVTDRGFSIGDVYDIREVVKLAAIGKILEPQSLLDVRNTLSAFYYLRNRLAEVAQDFPLLWNIAEGIIELRDLEKDISACFNSDSEIRDDASPKLAGIRQEIKSVRAGLLEHLQNIINSSKWHKAIQEPLVTEREGRYVIPLKVESRHEVKGIVHDVSNTGATVFVEPWVAVDAGNTLRELEIQEKYEVERILRSLSGRVGSYAAEITRSIALVAEIDLALAKAKYARKLNAVEPQLIASGEGKEKTGLNLVDAVHPLLKGNPVPLSVKLGKDFLILVITGPNTGGKTVALKTIGLLAMMAQAGLPIPASPESSLPLFDNIFADIGDEQSIAQTLSTFSWHVTNLAHIVNKVTDRSLVLLDELGTSTDPAEGSALARSLLLHFLRRGTLVVATTHFSDLKAFAHTTPGLQNASLDFDPVTLTPTYHLTVGVPGGSNALATASRLGLPEEIVSEARGFLSQGSQELEVLLADLVGEKKDLQDLRLAIEKERNELNKRNQDLENEMTQLHRDEHRILTDVKDQVVREAADLFREIREMAAALRKERSREKIEQAKRTLAAVEERLNSGIFVPPVTEKAESEKLNAGDTVWLKDGNVAGTVLTVFDDIKQVELQVGSAKLKVGLDSVEKIADAARQTSAQVIVKPAAGKARVSMELDLRGKRAEEIKELVDAYLDSAAVAGLGRVRIIHGYGTGVVRQIVREVLSTHSLVKSYHPGERGEGGDGVSVAELK